MLWELTKIGLFLVFGLPVLILIILAILLGVGGAIWLVIRLLSPESPKDSWENLRDQRPEETPEPNLAWYQPSTGAKVFLILLAILAIVVYLNYQKEEALAECMETAHQTYALSWNGNCERLGLEKECELPLSLAESIETSYNERKNDCFKRHPID